jgi:transglutaminase-like putative cysteine protease
MRLAIRHTTRYRFQGPVRHGIQRLRLTPKATQGQEIVEWSMDYDGAHEELAYNDQHHNHVILIGVEEGVQEVTITCHGQVRTEDKAGVVGLHAGHLPLWAFLGQTELTRAGPKVRELIASVKRSEEGMVSTLHNLSAAIRDQVEYKTGTTGVRTNAEEALITGSGVCQDHAHIFISAARTLEIPARYVSGYLMMNDRIDQEATHAWAEAWVQGLGWVGFDISNGISPDPRYVRLATGRDYRDAAPITGISFGTLTKDLSVNVAVEQQLPGPSQSHGPGELPPTPQPPTQQPDAGPQQGQSARQQHGMQQQLRLSS